MRMHNAAVVLLVGVGVSLAACGETPTSVAAPEQARFDGGWWGGSGNRSDSTAVVTTSSDSTDSRGGWWGGSGN